jgi:hypothetical protein
MGGRLVSRRWISRLGVARQLGSTPFGPILPRFFDSASFWNTKLAAAAPLVTDGNNYPAKFANQAAYVAGGSPIAGRYPAGYNDIVNVNSFSVPWYLIPTSGHARAKVTFMTNNGAGPAASDTDNNGLQLVLNSVPVPLGPSGAQFEDAYGTIQAAGSDGHAVIYDPFTDELWDFWKFKTVTDATSGGHPSSWHYECGYAGYIANASTAVGIFANGWGARASGLPACAGMIGMIEAAQASIPHKLCIAQISEVTPPLAPATRGDTAGSTTLSGDNSDGIPQGTMFRLPASYVVPSTLTPFAQAVQRAIRDYGVVVVDRSATIALYGEDPRTIGTPYTPVTSNPWTALAAAGNLSSVNNACYQIPFGQLQQVAYP